MILVMHKRNECIIRIVFRNGNEIVEANEIGVHR